MKITLRSVLLASLVVAAPLAGCRGDDSPKPGPSGDDPDAAPSGGDEVVTIAQVRGDLAEDKPVSLKGVVVTAVDNYAANFTGNFWVQDAAADGPGLLIFSLSQKDLAANLKVGDVVDVTHVIKDAYIPSTPPKDWTLPLIELKPIDKDTKIVVTKTGTATVQAPVMMDLAALSKQPISDQLTAWQKVSGRLVTVTNVDVATNVIGVGSTADYVGANLRGPLQVDSTLTKLPDTVKTGTCFASVTGVVDYGTVKMMSGRETFFKLLPRSADDFKTGDACPKVEEEAGATACVGGQDEDFDGLVDCGDASCQTLDSCVAAASVAEVQKGEKTGLVRLEKVVVTAINGGTVWVADSGTAAINNSVMLVDVQTPLPDTVKVGSVVNTTAGKVTENGKPEQNQVTQIGPTPTKITLSSVGTDTATLVPLTGVSVKTLADVKDGEPYEGLLVTITNVKLTAPAYTLTTMDDAKTPIRVTAGAAASNAALGLTGANVDKVCYSSVTGVMSAFTSSGERTINPRNIDELVKVDCPASP